MAHRLADTQLR